MVYIIEYFGDLPREKEFRPSCHASLEDALTYLREEHGFGTVVGWENNEQYKEYRTPDPEDDRIVIWEAEPGQPVKAVWHFSGWHWDGDAGDLPGGPLQQGKLLGEDLNLYAMAMLDY